ncbi:sugar phosphate isomerase/epimerase family protein [Actibacterium pelagium]|uniref:Xylose isomerase n=1 Tax=Actibacterium pelagium TaxID=2029103 RepID=A0A917ADI9_9RHOB|nr:sugar phosphate isomerase/epimerase [Actibacterium pelagium]GGE43771.1 xylose isomerase [Actibacterium pelagium]
MLSLAHLTAIDLPPPELIRLAGKVGFDAVGLRLIQVTPTSPGYPLMDDPVMMQETKAALHDTGILVHDIEFMKIEPDKDISALEPFLAAGAELGAKEVITAPYDPDLNRLADQLGAFSNLAAKYGLGVSLEFFPWTDVPDLKTAVRVVTQAGPKVGILIDSLHFDRSESSLDQLLSLSPERLRFAHLCDAPVHPPYSTEDLFHAGRAERLPPGDGQIDLVSFLQALPNQTPLGVEVPMSQLTKSHGPEHVAETVLKAAKALQKQVAETG